MTGTRHGDVVRFYSEQVERRPFSRFTADAAQQAANLDWLVRAMAWGKTHVDEYGNLGGDA